jgi:hypothetical protein
MPLWDVELCAKEAERALGELGLHSVAMAGEGHKAGLPDLGQPAWDPFYEVISHFKAPINIHIAAGVDAAEVGAAANWTKTAWPSLPARAHKPVNSVNMELANSRFVSNLLLSDLAFRWPGCQVGLGGKRHRLASLRVRAGRPRVPRNFTSDPAPTGRRRGETRRTARPSGSRPPDRSGCPTSSGTTSMRETDFPPTCLHPDAVRRSAEVLAGLGEDSLRKVVQDNAASLYHIDLS